MTEGAARPTGASFGDILVRLAGERPNLLVVAGEDPGPATWFAEIWPERVLTIPPVPTRTAVAEGIVRGGGDAIVVLEAEVTDLSVQPEAGIVMVTATAAHMAIAHRWALDVCQPGWPDDLPALLVGALGSPASAVLHLPVVPPEVTPSPGPTTFGAQRVLHRGPAGLVLGAGGTATLAREVATVLSRRQVEVTAMDLHTVTGGSGVDASLLAEHLLVGPLSTPRAAALTAVPVAGRDLTAVVDHIQRELRGQLSAGQELGSSSANTSGMSRSLTAAVLAVLLACSLVPGAMAQDLPLPGMEEEQPGEAVDAPDGEVLFPTDALTVADASQATGRRIALPLPDCTIQVSRCADIELLNTLDGFDLLPRVAIRLAAAPQGDLAAVFSRDVVGVRAAGDGDVIGLARLVYDPTSMTLYGEPEDQLVEGTAYDVVYRGQATRFTTLTASAGLAQMRRQLDDGTAYAAAGIVDADRTISFSQGDLRTVFPAQAVARITRYDEVAPGGALVGAMVIDSAVTARSTIAFGSFASPSWLDEARTIEPAPTGGPGPTVTGSERIGVTAILPAGTPPEGGWPVAIFGPGITRSKYDLFLAADLNAAQGLATVSFDPVGHAFGPGSEVGVQLNTSPDEVRFSGFGRGLDLNDDGVITNQEGVQAPGAPHPRSSVGLRDGLRQTAADLMALVRAIQQGADVDGDGTAELSTEDVSVYAQSLGGIYSTMMMGADPSVEVAVLNVPGGAILDIARVSPAFREVVGDTLRDRVPGLLNGGVNGFTEDLGLFGVDPPVSDPADGAMVIQELLYASNWVNRPGSPETFAPLLRTRPLADSRPKEVLYQFALGDTTVTNPSSFRLARAFGDDSRVSLYRNDRTATAMTNPHGFLLDPTLQGRNQAQQQVVDFITSGGQTITDPDGPLPTWEAPIADRDVLLPRNFSEDLYEAPTDRPAREVRRVGSDDAVTSAAAVSAATFPSAATAVLARVDDYADGLAGAPLAAEVGGPLLLSDASGLSDASAAEVQRLEAEVVILLGGTSALSEQVATDLEDLGVEVQRIGGDNRFATAALVAERIGYRSEVLLVQGEDVDPTRGWPDALSAAGIGAGLGQPILLTGTDRLPQETAAALSPTQDVTIVGGVAAVGEDVGEEVDALVDDLDRLAGANRYGTTARAADDAILRGLRPADVWLATGASFATGLAAGAAAGATDGIFMLVDPTSLDAAPDVARWLRQHGASVDVATVVGGPAVVGPSVETAIGAAIR